MSSKMFANKSAANKSVANKSVANKSATNLYCKVCHDSGKPESEYRSHSTRETRDPNSKITCPILLAIECRFCHKGGHTVKYCPALKDKKKDEARALKKLSIPKTNTVVQEKVANFYDCLLEDDCLLDDAIEEDFPITMNTVISTNNSNSQLNYAAALAKPEMAQPRPPAPMVRTASVMNKSWVQMSMESDSDEEDGSAW